MSEDAPVNTGAVSGPDPLAARVTARKTQTKLHLRAARDPGRRFGRVEVRPQRGRAHRRRQRQGDLLPLSQWQHPGPRGPRNRRPRQAADVRVRHAERPVR
jgi:hypothetical protein